MADSPEEMEWWRGVFAELQWQADRGHPVIVGPMMAARIRAKREWLARLDKDADAR